MTQTVVNITSDGTARFIYDEPIGPALCELGGESVDITRASHVEPLRKGHVLAGWWIVDLSPVNGPRLGPYRTREEALDRERVWIEQNVLGVHNGTSH